MRDARPGWRVALCLGAPQSRGKALDPMEEEF